MPETEKPPILRLESVDSTNSWLMNFLEHHQTHGLTVIAQEQTSGRGRLGRSFVSIPKKSLTFSRIVHSKLSEEDLGIFALIAGIAVARSLEALTTLDPQLKWPNDVLINGKKVCGILCETTGYTPQGHMIVIMGIGLNVNGFQNEYPTELQNLLTTLEQETSTPIELESLFQKIIQELDILYQMLPDRKFQLLQEWLQRSKSVGKPIQYQTSKGWQEGSIESLSSQGFLQIRTPSGDIHTHISGDIRLV